MQALLERPQRPKEGGKIEIDELATYRHPLSAIMNARALQRMMQPFESYNNTHIEQVFDIPSSKDLLSTQKRICVKFEPSTRIDQLTLIIHFQERSLIEAHHGKMMNVSEDVERLIYSYLKRGFTLKIHLDLSGMPYRGPKATFLSSTDPRIDMTKLVDQFTCDARHDWSPALGIEKAVLILLSRILEAIGYV